MSFPFLRIQGLVKNFGNIRAVDNISLDIEKGQIVGLIGPNGSGKSTLINLISGVLKPEEGSIFFKGERIDSLNPPEIFNKGIVRSFQIPALFWQMRIFENPLVPPKNQVGERPIKAPFHRLWHGQEKELATTALSELQRLTLDRVLLNRASEVSGGQMKLLDLARALMSTPKLMLFDEPTAGVAPALAQNVYSNIHRLREEVGITFLIVEHRLDILFKHVERVLVMHQGRIIYDGDPLGVYKDKKVVEAYLGE